MYKFNSIKKNCYLFYEQHVQLNSVKKLQLMYNYEMYKKCKIKYRKELLRTKF